MYAAAFKRYLLTKVSYQTKVERSKFNGIGKHTSNA